MSKWGKISTTVQLYSSHYIHFRIKTIITHFMNIKPIFILSSFVLFISINSFAQEVEVKGRVLNAQDNSSVEFATVSFLTASDSSLIKGDVTDLEGNFAVPIAPGNYILKAEFLAFKPTFKAIQVSSDRKTQNIGTIRLQEDVAQLSEVVVRGERTQMEMTLDKRVYNIGQDLVNRGGDASQILDNLPSVSVDMEGNVSLRGSSSVKVLINGKPSGLIGISGTEALRQLDANMVERVEVITNPSARYEAEGMAGIINIVLKKEERLGINGTFNFKTGIPDDHGVSLNVNFRRDWFNLFTNYAFTYRDSPRDGTSFQRFSDYTTDIVQDIRRKGISNSIRFGGDIYINDQNTLTLSGIYRISDDENLGIINYTDRALSGTLLSNTIRRNEEAEDESVWEYAINYTRTFSEKDHKLTIDLQYRENDEIEDADIIETRDPFEMPRETLLQGYLNDEFQNSYLLQADYVRPFSETTRLETGWRTNIRKIDNSYLVEEQNESGIWVPLPAFTNDFIYNEQVHSWYGIFGTEINKFSLQGGVRAEYTNVDTELRQTNEQNNQEYLHIFPSAHVTYAFDNANSVQMSYSKRYNRPGFWHLNPFHSYADSRNIRSGNPNLKPEFTDSYELGYLRTWTDGTFYFGAYYRHTTDEFERIEVLEDSVIRSFPINLSVENAYGLEANFSKELFSRLNLDGNLNFYQSISDGEYEGEDLYSKTTTMTGRLNAQIKLFNDFNFQANTFYRAPRTTTQGKNKSMYSLDLGVSKEIFNRNGTVVLNVRNVLNTLRGRSETFAEGFYARSDFRWRPRQITLSLVYRLNRSNGQDRQRPQQESMDFDDGDM